MIVFRHESESLEAFKKTRKLNVTYRNFAAAESRRLGFGVG